MNKAKICIASQYSVGCTFLDWSIHFLSGQINFFNTKHGIIPLSDNPLSKINAHGHLKNHPSGLEETQQVIEILQKHHGLTSYYPSYCRANQVADLLNIDWKRMSSNQWKTIQNYQIDNYNQILHNSYNNCEKIIFISLNKNLSVYATTQRAFERMLFEDRTANSVEEIRNSYDDIFFKDTKKWKDLNLTNTWDVRERRALASNLLKYNIEQVDLKFEHYWLDSQNLWYNGDREVQKIMSWLGLSIDPLRYNSWILIYRDWQKLQIDLLQFEYNYKHIVESIVNNWSYPIDLTFDQEIVIQHCLIYHHGLNLKTWQLEKFPNNTQELHKLLEPNIHPLGDL